MKMKSILSGLIVVCAACMFLAASRSQASNKPTEETPMATVCARYTVDDIGAAIQVYSKLTELAGVRYLIGDARAAVDFYTIHLGFNVAPTAGAITSGRARALVAVAVGLISLVIGGLALARSAGRIGAGNGRSGAIVALALGLIGMVLSVAHLGSSTGGFGTGSG